MEKQSSQQQQQLQEAPWKYDLLRKMLTNGGMINGLTLDHINRRARPIHDNSQDEEWRSRSLDGFICSEDEEKDLPSEEKGILGVISKDENTVRQLNTTHQELASHFSALLKLADNIGKVQATISYDCSRLAENTLYQLKPQPIQVEKQTHIGHQYSLFYNFNHKDVNTKLNTTWNTEWTITNTNNWLSLKIGGDEHRGSLDYIAQFGFYQGGTFNEFRIDPILAVAILTGRVTLDVVSIVKSKGSAKYCNTTRNCKHWSTNVLMNSSSIHRANHS